MNIALENLKHTILKIKDRATEASYYPSICRFIEEFETEKFKKRKELNVTPLESSKIFGTEIGFPDLTVRHGEILVGWIEVKPPTENLNNDRFKAQFKKYKDSLENIIFTNLREWQLWQWDEKGESKRVAEVLFDVIDFGLGEENKIENIIIKFLEGKAYEARTPKQLALALAKKTKLLSQQVEEAFDKSNEDSDLYKLKDTFEKTLIQNISTHQFANMVSETMAYSLLLAFLENIHRGNGKELNLTTAIDFLPKNVPILADLYSLVKKISGNIPKILSAVKLLVDQLRHADIGRIYHKLVDHKIGEDPVIQFYEPFLKEYDPKEREARGVYYTPKPVVDYIIRSVDWILQNKFGKEYGLAEETVNILDPASGTGTFLMSAIQSIYGGIYRKYSPLGGEMVKQEFNRVALSHILKHFYGFELLIAPYAIAHLKLTLEIERLGFDFALTKDDNDKDNDRFKVYLANTLDDPNQPPQRLFGFESIPQESENARVIKKNVPILAIIGNPPYSNYGQMNPSTKITGRILKGQKYINKFGKQRIASRNFEIKEPTFIGRLLEDYKKGLKERKINLDDDFIKFIRFAQWKLEQTGQGIFAMITSNTFIDGITHRQMRRSLMDTFEEIYIYNLHGSSRKGEATPDGEKDENVFNIQQGVSINIFIKFPKRGGNTTVKYCDLYGLRENKFSILLERDFEKTKWLTLEPKEPNWFFVKKDIVREKEYSEYWRINDIFSQYNSGIQTKRDALTVQFDENALQLIVKDFSQLKVAELREKYHLPPDGRDWTIQNAKDDLAKNNPKIVKILYRPFDIRKTFFTGKTKGFVAYPRTDTMLHMLEKNLGLITSRQQVLSGFRHLFVTKDIIESAAVSIKTKEWNYLYPLYLYKPKNQQLSIGDIGRGREELPSPNISTEFIKIFSEKLKLKYINYGTGDGSKTFGPADVFYYCYAIWHSPTYRTRYAEQLKIDFPRLPVTSEKQLFNGHCRLGKQLVNLHLLGENPFETSKTVFDKPDTWGVKIGGTKPDSIDNWKIVALRYDAKNERLYLNSGQYFEGIGARVWEFVIGSYQVCEKWLYERKKADKCLSGDDLKYFMKIVVAIRETIRVIEELDKIIQEHGGWPIK